MRCSGVNSQSKHRNLTATDSKSTPTTPFSKDVSSKDKLTAGVEVSLRRVKSFRDLLFTTRCMVRVCSNGQMVEFITATSNQARRVAKVCISGRMAKSTTESSRMITAKALESDTLFINLVYMIAFFSGYRFKKNFLLLF